MNLTDLRHYARFLAIGDENNIIDYPDAILTRNINNWYDIVNSWIWNSAGTWEFDDSNYTTLPIAFANLVDKQNNYELPTIARSIDIVEIKSRNGNWKRLIPLDKSQIIGSPEEIGSGMPIFYDMKGRSIILYPTPLEEQVSLEGGLQIYLSRSVIPLVNPTDIPGFDKSFSRILSIGAAMDYAISKGDIQKQAHLRNMIFDPITGLKPDLEKFFGKRNKEFKQRINLRRENYK